MKRVWTLRFITDYKQFFNFFLLKQSHFSEFYLKQFRTIKFYYNIYLYV